MSTSKIEISDRELMRFYDGELDDERAEEVERWLDGEVDGDRHEAALDKLAGLDLAGELLIEAVDGDARADDVVDAVMARLDAVDEGGADEADEDEAPDEVELAPLKKAPLEKAAPPANDNAARIYMLAAAAAAAAAGLFIWGNQGQEIEPPPHAYVPPATMTAEPTARPMAPAPETTAMAVAEEEDDGVEIAAVDFGTHRGSVFYVGNASAGRSAVVWINDAGEP